MSGIEFDENEILVSSAINSPVMTKGRLKLVEKEMAFAYLFQIRKVAFTLGIFLQINIYSHKKLY